KLKIDCASINNLLAKEQKKLDDLVISYSKGLQEQSNIVKDLKIKLDSKYNKRQDLLNFYRIKIVKEDDTKLLNGYFPDIKDYKLLAEVPKPSKKSSDLPNEEQKKLNTYKLPTLEAIYNFETQ
ncbi:unnamed protein product, partial [Rotaria socialis]